MVGSVQNKEYRIEHTVQSLKNVHLMCIYWVFIIHNTLRKWSHSSQFLFLPEE